jgi:hypothetical protein
MRMNITGFGSVQRLRNDRTNEVLVTLGPIDAKCPRCSRENRKQYATRLVSWNWLMLRSNVEVVGEILDSAKLNCDCDRARCRIAPKVQRKYRGRFEGRSVRT